MNNDSGDNLTPHAPEMTAPSGCIDLTELEANVRRFVRHFNGEIEIISSASLGYYEKKYRCLLLCCLIDTVSNIIEESSCATNKNELDKKKFLLAIQLYGNWPDCTRICRPVLEKLMKEANGSDFDGVRSLLNALPPWPDQHHGPTVSVADVDPEFERVSQVWPLVNEKFKPVSFNGRKVFPELIQHHSLLYDSRNKLIHELRTLTSESEDSLGHTQPYYHRTRDWNGRFWQLHMPPEFLANVAKNVLSGLQVYCLDHKIDPFTRLI